VDQETGSRNLNLYHCTALTNVEAIKRRGLLPTLTGGSLSMVGLLGLAEGLRKPVIYLCRAGVETHFDTDHRQTVRWDLNDLDGTAKRLKAVIRNTLLGGAKQDD